MRQSAEGVDVLPDVLGDGGGGGDGSSGNNSDADDGGPAGEYNYIHRILFLYLKGYME